MNDPSDPVIFQLKAVIAGISPMIWRRLHIHSDTNLADLHYILQICFGWSDEYLHRFTIHGKHFGISKLGGEGFSDDANTITLAALGLRERERFLYNYNYFDNWQIQLRVEQILSPEAGQSYPTCIQGKRAGPPEDCGGPWAFQELRQEHSEFEVAYQVVQMVVNEEFDQLEAQRQRLLYWGHAGIEQFFLTGSTEGIYGKAFGNSKYRIYTLQQHNPKYNYAESFSQ